MEEDRRVKFCFNLAACLWLCSSARGPAVGPHFKGVLSRSHSSGREHSNGERMCTFTQGLADRRRGLKKASECNISDSCIGLLTLSTTLFLSRTERKRCDRFSARVEKAKLIHQPSILVNNWKSSKRHQLLRRWLPAISNVAAIFGSLIHFRTAAAGLTAAVWNPTEWWKKYRLSLEMHQSSMRKRKRKKTLKNVIWKTWGATYKALNWYVPNILIA